MVAEGPVDATADRAFASCVAADLEVPDAGGCCDDELADAHDERIYPEEHEELVDDNVARVLVPLHLRDEWVAFTRFRLTDGENENGANEPGSEPNDADEVGAQWQQEDPEIRGHVLGCRLVDGDSNPD